MRSKKLKKKVSSSKSYQEVGGHVSSDGLLQPAGSCQGFEVLHILKLNKLVLDIGLRNLWLNEKHG